MRYRIERALMILTVAVGLLIVLTALCCEGRVISIRDTVVNPKICGWANGMERAAYEAWGAANGLTLQDDCPVYCGEDHATCWFSGPSGRTGKYWCADTRPCAQIVPDPYRVTP